MRGEISWRVLGQGLAILSLAAALAGCGGSNSNDSASTTSASTISSSSAGTGSSTGASLVGLTLSGYTAAPSSTAIVAIYRSGNSTGATAVGYTTVTSVVGQANFGSPSAVTVAVALTPGGTSSSSSSGGSGSSTFTVSASGSNVGIAPSAAQSVPSGTTVVYQVTAAAGDALSSAVGGTCPSGSWNGSAYTTGAITAICSVMFSASPSAAGSGNSASSTPISGQRSGLWSIGFWGGGSTSSLDGLWGGLTHMILIGVEPSSTGDGSLSFFDATYSSDAAELISKAHAKNVKVLMMVATWTDPTDWGDSTGKNLTSFVNNIMNLVNTYGFDGVDLDWEGDFGSAYYTNMANLVGALRLSLGSKILTADIGVDDFAFWAQQAANMDRLSAMTYDEAGNWNPYSWFNSALESDSCDCVWSLDLTRRRALAAGLPAAKINLGLPFYGYVSTGGNVTGPRQSIAGQPTMSQMSYADIVANYDVSSPSWDSVAQVPWISTPNGWVTFDNPQSITAKVQYIQKQGLGGWIIWNNSSDYVATQNPSHPLLAAIQSAVGPSLNH
jgi:chitinase